ncbi:MAG: hypothetical protein H6882_11790 [Rhodobiaceae bacterium]|nr:hypothetical protein [Rhodobiaceae bacterium]
MQRYLSLLILITICLVTANAHAACTGPAGNEGDQIYNQTHKTMQFCDGTLWYSMKGGAQDALAGLSCSANQIAKWNGSAWVCALDAGLTVETDPQVASTTNGKWCVGNGSAVTCTQSPPSGDDLGSHIATKSLNMGGFSISNVYSINADGVYATQTNSSGTAVTGTGSSSSGKGGWFKGDTGVRGEATSSDGIGGWFISGYGSGTIAVKGQTTANGGIGGLFSAGTYGTALRVNGSSVFTGVSTFNSPVTFDSQVDLTNAKIVNLATPTAANDAANKAYVDSVAGGGGEALSDCVTTDWGDMSGCTTYPEPAPPACPIGYQFTGIAAFTQSDAGCGVSAVTNAKVKSRCCK